MPEFFFGGVAFCWLLEVFMDWLFGDGWIPGRVTENVFGEVDDWFADEREVGGTVGDSKW